LQSMMVFSMQGFLSRCKRLCQRVVAFAIVVSSVCFSISSALAADAIEITSTRLERSIDGDSWMLNIDVDMQLGPRLEDAVNKGLPLYFVVEFEVSKPRWYWFDEKSANKVQSYKLSYHALTRQYRVALGMFQQSFNSLPEAVAAMSRIRSWKVGDVDQFGVGNKYEAQVRMRLDNSQLPKPFQIIGITNKDWTMGSDWKQFVFVPRQGVQ
jgi:Domain of unknown function (DUF4390)